MDGLERKKVILIGDSIREGYDSYTKKALEEVADVFYPEENCRFTAYILRNLTEWKAWYQWPEDIDLIHWNAGLWDLIRLLDGKNHTPLPVYQEYVERICKIMRILFPKAKIVFATCTPVIERLHQECSLKRANEEIETYNAAAVEIVQRYGASINDLYSLMAEAPESYHSDMTHYYTKEGTKLLTEQVVSCIEKELGIQGKKLDYDSLFEEKDKAKILG